ncbi:uncharacterized protein C8A04DRAFT_29487 [Dichotomopilus funicola]|uniref:Uncharacterized protein n=1 Tax=Dichotomopilus funicola TaxID=1934379 RepID=A0AAN6ZKS5_9PEZI|nr:hypothetical protein C8A04DRAFT_29487 [Dichotomopilus funicola]
MPSSPKYKSARYNLSIPQGLLDSPAAKRAKRSRRNRKNRARNASKSSPTTNDQVSSGHSVSAEGTFARKETPIPPPTMPQSQNFSFSMKDEKGKSSIGYENNTKQSNSAPGKDPKNGTWVNSSQIVANTRKTRAEPQSNDRWGQLHNRFSYYEPPADPGPSKPWVAKSPAPQPKELTPYSEFTPKRSMTFKDYPNPVANRLPPVIQVSPEPRKRKRAASAKESTQTTTAAAPGNNSGASMTPTINLITSDEMSSAPTSATIPVTSPIPTSTPSHAASSESKTLKAINKRLKSIEAGLAALTTTTAAAAAAAHSGSSVAGSSNAAQGDSQTRGHGQGLKGMDPRMIEQFNRVHEDIRLTGDHLVRNQMRATIRHNTIFDFLVKIAEDVTTLNGEVARLRKTGAEGQDGDGDGDTKGKGVARASPSGSQTPHRRGTPTSPAKKEETYLERLRKSRNTLRSLLGIYMTEMNAADNEEDVEKHATLVEAYAKDVFSTFL